MKLKHRLPLIAELPHLSLSSTELEQLKNIIKDLNKEFVSVLEANKKLCGIHHILASSVYDNFFQIPLTDNAQNQENISLEECELEHKQLNSNQPIKNMRHKLSIVNDPLSPYNEKQFTIKTKTYNDYHELFNGIFSRFKGKPTRTRLVKLLGNTNILPHIDYDPSYAVRVIIPLISPKECINLFWDRKEIKGYHLQEGIAYFLNTGYKHSVVNMSNEDRYTLLISVDNTEDIDNLISN